MIGQINAQAVELAPICTVRAEQPASSPDRSHPRDRPERLVPNDSLALRADLKPSMARLESGALQLSHVGPVNGQYLHWRKATRRGMVPSAFSASIAAG
jgi:hypothetical protein